MSPEVVETVKTLRRNPVIVLLKRLGIVLLLYTVCRLLFLLFNFSNFSDSRAVHLVFAFIYGVRFDVAAIVITNAVFILMHLAPLGYFAHRRYQLALKIVFYASNAIPIALNCIDLAYFKYTLKRSTVDLFYLMGLPEHNLVPKLLADFWFIVLLGIGLIALTEYLYRKVKVESSPDSLKRRLATQGMLFVPMIAACIIAGRGGLQLRPISVLSAAQEGPSQNTSLILNTPFCMLQTIGRAELKEAKFFPADEAAKLFPIVHSFDRPDEPRKLNVVVIVLESFGKEYVGSLNNGIGYTPFFDSLVERSLVFPNSFANGKRSMDGIPAILSGMPALMNSPFITSAYGSAEINSLASLLKKDGYRSAFYHGGENGTMGFNDYARKVGFDRYYGMSEYNNEAHSDGFWGIYDEEFFQYFAKGLCELPGPFVACCFSLSSHHPYNIPERYKGQFSPGTMKIHPSIQYTDLALKRFFETAQTMPWYENTLFVLVADHTAQAEAPFYKNRVGMYAIPILFFRPNGELKGVRDDVAQQTDILPTVLDYLNYKGKFTAFGSSLLDPAAPRCAVNFHNGTYQIISDPYCLHLDGHKSVGLFRYDRDPTLSMNLSGQVPSVERELARKLKAAIQQFNYGLLHNRLLTK